MSKHPLLQKDSHRQRPHSLNSDNPPLYSDHPSGSTNIFYNQSSDLDSFSVKDTASCAPSPLVHTHPLPSDSEVAQVPATEPPEFSLYQASYTIDTIGNITSHDPHLNSDGEALCRFILLHTSSPPGLIVKLSGTHEDVRIETTTEYVNGRTEYRNREERPTVTDFSFTMQVPSDEALDHGVRELYVVSDGEVVSRGGHRRTRGKWENGKDLGWLHQTENEDISLDLPGRGTAGVGFKERRKADKIAQEVKTSGHPPFIPAWMFPHDTFSCEPDRPPEHLLGPSWETKSCNFFNSLVHRGYYRQRKPNHQPSLTVERELRQWCDDYCANKKHLKEFRVKKLIFGWNLALLEEELLKLLNSTPYLRSTHFSVDFETTSSQIIIRPVNIISKIFSLTGFSKFILTITLIYPTLWCMRYLIFGAQYDVIRAAYPLVYWKKPDHSSQFLDQNLDDELSGQTELNWLSAHQHKISLACQNCKIGSL